MLRARKKEETTTMLAFESLELMNKEDVLLRRKANKELSKIFYSGAKKKGDY